MRVFLTVMKMTTHAIDDALSAYTHQRIYEEINKNIEDVIFFSSYSIDTSIFRKATQKLKKKLREKNNSELFLWEEEAKKVITAYDLKVQAKDPYLLRGLLKAQIDINEAMLSHFTSLHKKAYDFDYLEGRAQQIHTLLSE
jgi:hypothetical protein